jgi:hypothetical protein
VPIKIKDWRPFITRGSMIFNPFATIGLYVSVCDSVMYFNLRRYNEYLHNVDIQLYTMRKFDYN